jgi:hypothetical protein
MLRSKRWSVFLLIPLLTLLMAARQVPLIDPQPIEVPAGMSDAQIKKSIRAALLGRGWMLNEENPGKVVSTLNLRKHTAKIEVDYDTKQVRIKHLESINLLEEDKKGQRVIHRTYVTWINNVVLDITRNLQLTSG